MIRKMTVFILLASFLAKGIVFPQTVEAQSVIDQLPVPGSMVLASASWQPLMIKGLKVHPENPMLFDFLVSKGNETLSANDPQVKTDSQRLIKYFLACLAIPEDDLWVNLSPYEKDRMIPDALGKTELGRDLLAQDYILKQLTASMIYPEKDLGKAFWDKVYKKAQQLYGKTQIPVNTFNKVWILADTAKVFEKDNTAFVVNSHLKVMLDEDYLAMNKHMPTRGHHEMVSPSTLPSKIGLNVKASQGNPGSTNEVDQLSSQIIREIVLPEIEKEINQGKNFATIRQIFHAFILASWYKKNLKTALLNQVYTDKGKINGVNADDPSVKDQIYQRYLQAYKKGVFNYIKEDQDSATQQPIPRKYFSGGTKFNSAMVTSIKDPAQLTSADNAQLGDVDFAVTTNLDPSDAAMNAQQELDRGWQNIEQIKETLLPLTSITQDSRWLGAMHLIGDPVTSLRGGYDLFRRTVDERKKKGEYTAFLVNLDQLRIFSGIFDNKFNENFSVKDKRLKSWAERTLATKGSETSANQVDFIRAMAEFIREGLYTSEIDQYMVVFVKAVKDNSPEIERIIRWVAQDYGVTIDPAMPTPEPTKTDAAMNTSSNNTVEIHPNGDGAIFEATNNGEVHIKDPRENQLSEIAIQHRGGQFYLQPGKLWGDSFGISIGSDGGLAIKVVGQTIQTINTMRDKARITYTDIDGKSQTRTIDNKGFVDFQAQEGDFSIQYGRELLMFETRGGAITLKNEFKINRINTVMIGLGKNGIVKNNFLRMGRPDPAVSKPQWFYIQYVAASTEGIPQSLIVSDTAMLAELVVNRNPATGYLTTSTGQEIVLTEEMNSFLRVPFEYSSEYLPKSLGQIEEWFQYYFVKEKEPLSPPFSFLDVASLMSGVQQIIDAIPTHFDQMIMEQDRSDRQASWLGAVRFILKEAGVVDQMNSMKQQQIPGFGFIRLKIEGTKEILTSSSRLDGGGLFSDGVNPDQMFDGIFPVGDLDRQIIIDQVKKWLGNPRVRTTREVLRMGSWPMLSQWLEMECQKPVRVLHDFDILTYENKPSGLARIQRLVNYLSQPVSDIDPFKIRSSRWMQYIDPRFSEYKYGNEDDPEGINAKAFIIELLSRWGLSIPDAAMTTPVQKVDAAMPTQRAPDFTPEELGIINLIASQTFLDLPFEYRYDPAEGYVIDAQESGSERTFARLRQDDVEEIYYMGGVEKKLTLQQLDKDELIERLAGEGSGISWNLQGFRRRGQLSNILVLISPQDFDRTFIVRLKDKAMSTQEKISLGTELKYYLDHAGNLFESRIQVNNPYPPEELLITQDFVSQEIALRILDLVENALDQQPEGQIVIDIRKEVTKEGKKVIFSVTNQGEITQDVWDQLKTRAMEQINKIYKNMETDTFYVDQRFTVLGNPPHIQPAIEADIDQLWKEKRLLWITGLNTGVKKGKLGKHGVALGKAHEILKQKGAELTVVSKDGQTTFSMVFDSADATMLEAEAFIQAQDQATQGIRQRFIDLEKESGLSGLMLFAKEGVVWNIADSGTPHEDLARAVGLYDVRQNNKIGTRISINKVQKTVSLFPLALNQPSILNEWVEFLGLRITDIPQSFREVSSSIVFLDFLRKQVHQTAKTLLAAEPALYDFKIFVGSETLFGGLSEELNLSGFVEEYEKQDKSDIGISSISGNYQQGTWTLVLKEPIKQIPEGQGVFLINDAKLGEYVDITGIVEGILEDNKNKPTATFEFVSFKVSSLLGNNPDPQSLRVEIRQNLPFNMTEMNAYQTAQTVQFLDRLFFEDTVSQRMDQGYFWHIPPSFLINAKEAEIISIITRSLGMSKTDEAGIFKIDVSKLGLEKTDVDKITEKLREYRWKIIFTMLQWRSIQKITPGDEIVVLYEDFKKPAGQRLQVVRGRLKNYYDLGNEIQFYFVDHPMLSIPSTDRSWVLRDAPDAAMIKTPGGIDLKASDLKMDVQKQGTGVQMNFDPALIEQFKSSNFTGVVPVIIKITPINGAWQTIGLKAPVASSTQLASV